MSRKALTGNALKLWRAMCNDNRCTFSVKPDQAAMLSTANACHMTDDEIELLAAGEFSEKKILIKARPELEIADRALEDIFNNVDWG